MLAAFWSELGGGVARQWLLRVLTPGFGFWLGGLAALWWPNHREGAQSHGWAGEFRSTATAAGNLPTVEQAAGIVAFLLVVVVSALAAEWLTLPVLRLLEGYGWRPRRVRQYLIDRRRQGRHRWQERVERLSVRQRLGSLTTAEFLELQRLEVHAAADPGRIVELRQRRSGGFDAAMMAELGRGRRILKDSPGEDALGMPTRLGDILRAAEHLPAEKYGLDAVVCWCRLWLVLPAEAKTELAQARTALDNTARTWLWGTLFLVWVPWTWWVAPIGVATATLAYYAGMLPAARTYGDLVVSVFDLYRFRLYDACNLPRPTTPTDERHHDGPQLTNTLWAGLADPDVQYLTRTSDPEPDSA